MSATEAPEAEAPAESIEDRAKQEPPAQEPIPGTDHQLTLIAGGETPDSAEVKFRGGSVPIEGQFDKGEVVEVVIKIRIAEVHFVDKIDKFENVTSTVRRHQGKMVSVRRA